MSSQILLAVLLVSLFSTPVQASVEKFARTLTATLQTLDTKEAHDRDVGHLHHMNDKVDNRKRTRRLSSHTPYTEDPYDLGPIGMCSYPQLDVCNFPEGYTVPEYTARAVNNYNDILNELKDSIGKVDGSTCLESMMDFMCNNLVTPRCISNTTVLYPSDTLSKCQQALSWCPTLSFYARNYCSVIVEEIPSGSFSLTTCRVPKVDGCMSTRPSPDWIVAQIEHSTKNHPLGVVVNKLNLNGSCEENFMKLACTKPTCESNGRLQGYKNATQCNGFLDCLSEPKLREMTKIDFQCNHMDSLRKPSRHAGRRSPTGSADITIRWKN